MRLTIIMILWLGSLGAQSHDCLKDCRITGAHSADCTYQECPKPALSKPAQKRKQSELKSGNIYETIWDDGPAKPAAKKAVKQDDTRSGGTDKTVYRNYPQGFPAKYRNFVEPVDVPAIQETLHSKVIVAQDDEACRQASWENKIVPPMDWIFDGKKCTLLPFGRLYDWQMHGDSPYWYCKDLTRGLWHDEQPAPRTRYYCRKPQL